MSKGFDDIIGTLEVATRRIDTATLSLMAHHLNHEQYVAILEASYNIDRARNALQIMAQQRNMRWAQRQPPQGGATETDS